MSTALQRQVEARSQIEALLHVSTLGMRRNIDTPREVRNKFEAVCRSQPRRNHLLGSYVEVADAFASHGAPYIDVCGPMNTLKGWLWARHFQPQLPSVMEVTARETNANNGLDHAQFHVLKDPRREVIDAAIEMCDVQITETRLYKQTLLAMRYAGIK